MKLPTSRPANEATAALRRLGVSVRELRAAPEITPLLKLADGGLKRCLAAMRFSNDPLIRRFFAKYNSLSSHDQKRLPLEAVALAAGLDPSHLLGPILAALVVQGINIDKIIAVTHHHKITQARVQFGQLPLGEKDRTALDVAMGFLPSPKGGVTVISKAVFGSAITQQRSEANEGEDRILGEDELDLDRLFPPANLMQEKLNAIRQRQLPQPDRLTIPPDREDGN